MGSIDYYADISNELNVVLRELCYGRCVAP
jgi:hypothetical protein